MQKCTSPSVPQLKVRSPDGNEICFKIKRSTAFQKIINAYCERMGKSTNDVRLLFEGKRINLTDTPADVRFWRAFNIHIQLDMEDEDVIDAQVNQIGGSLCQW
jgi:small ubiquitin-related modifier